MAKKTARNYAESSGRNPEVRQKSRQAQNVRRKIERRMARIISEETGEKVYGKEAVELYESGIGESSQLSALYKARQSLTSEKGKSGYSVNVQQVSESVEAFTEIRFGQSQLNRKGTSDKYRRNKMFERNINQSTMRNGLSALSKEETKAFYAGTRDLWSGQTVASNRNATIMQQFGLTDLQQVYELLTKEELDYEEFGFFDEESFEEWLKELDDRTDLLKRREIIVDELRDIRNAQMRGGTTDDEAYNGADVKTAETSPEYANRIVSRIAVALNGY